jgi:uroporphyrinogen III methyltransferase/synthase
MGSPSVIVVGTVAGLTLGAARPLAGRTVVLTRPRSQAEELASALVAGGARVLRVPTIRLAAPEGAMAARAAAAAAEVADYDWVLFTSANAVDRFLSYLRDGRAFGRAKLAAVGPATAAALARHSLLADLVPDRRDAEGLAAALPDPPSGGRVLFPRAEGAREVVPEVLASRGWRVDEVVTYRTVPADPPDAALAAEVADADAVVFASPSAVESFAGMADPAGSPLVMPPVVVCIGPATAGAAARVTGGPVVTSAGPTPGDLVAALERALGAVRSRGVPPVG